MNADTCNHRIRKVLQNGIIKTIAGTGVVGYNGDDQLAVNAHLHLSRVHVCLCWLTKLNLHWGMELCSFYSSSWYGKLMLNNKAMPSCVEMLKRTFEGVALVVTVLSLPNNKSDWDHETVVALATIHQIQIKAVTNLLFQGSYYWNVVCNICRLFMVWITS